MHYLKVTSILLALGYASYALPATDQANNADISKLISTNRITQVAAGKKPSGAQAVLNAYRKYNKKPPAAVLHAVAKRAVAATTTSKTTTTVQTTTAQSASVAATDLPNDKAYYVNVTVGKTNMLLNMDTGSSDLWVFSSLLPANQRGKHPIYPLSGTAQQGETWQIAYGEGSSASGAVYADKVAIGKVTATVQAVEAASSVSSSFVSGVQDGIVGLGFEVGNECEPNYCYTFMQQVAPTLPSPVFTATLRHNKPGEYDFGFVDKTKYTGALTYNALTGELGGGFWEFSLGGYAVGAGAAVSDDILSIADTGTSLLLIDQDVVNAYYANVPGATYSSTYGGVIFPCSSTGKLQSLSLYINGVKHTMPAAYGVYLQIGDAAKNCFGGVQPNTDMDFSIIGDVFLKSQFVVFDVHTPQIGFAQQAGVTV